MLVQDNPNCQINTTTKSTEIFDVETPQCEGKNHEVTVNHPHSKTPLSTIIDYNRFSLDQSRGYQNYNISSRITTPGSTTQ